MCSVALQGRAQVDAGDAILYANCATAARGVAIGNTAVLENDDATIDPDRPARIIGIAVCQGQINQRQAAACDVKNAMAIPAADGMTVAIENVYTDKYIIQ